MDKNKKDNLTKIFQKEESHTRSHYEDPGHQYSDWFQKIGLEKNVFNRWYDFLEEKFSVKQLFILFGFSLILSYLIFFQLTIPHQLNVGLASPTDVTSPFNFEMIDEVSSEEKRARAESGILVVYDYDTNIFERTASHIYRAFRLMRNLGSEMQWPRSGAQQEDQIRKFFEHKEKFEKDLGTPIADYLYEWLVDNRFQPKIENALVRNIELWYQKKIADSPERFIPSHQNDVSARVVHKDNLGKEFILSKSEIIDLQVPDHFTLIERKSLEKLSETDRQNLLYLARSLVVPNLTLNRQESAQRKQVARDAILPNKISIKRNQVIVPKGTLVQPYQMAIVKQIESLQSDQRKHVMALALALLLSVFVLVQYSYIQRFTLNKVAIQFKDLFVMMIIAIGVIFMTKFYMFVADAAFISKFGNAIMHTVFLYAAPVASGSMLVGLLMASGEVVWLYTVFIAVSLGLMEDFNFSFTLVSLVGGVAAARGVYNCKKRNDVYRAGIRVGIINAIMVTFLFLINAVEMETMSSEIWWSVPAAFFGGIFSTLVTLMVIPLLESVFNYTTDVKLLELSNLNHPLLREMLLKAPGTYHHSMMVGNMVEAAAEEIGANSLLGKVMSYYHDIGKVAHSNYFIENQRPGHNPHDHISPFMSRTLLIAHVKDGVELGLKYKLGKPIIDGIIQHHGTTVISYFYNKALDLKTDEDPDFSEDEFRYPGPKPQFRESALCMLADSIEAAARSLDEPTPSRLQNIVKNVIQRKFADGQLDECHLTLKEIAKVEMVFSRIILGIYHQRIDYPKSAGGGLADATNPSVKVVK